MGPTPRLRASRSRGPISGAFANGFQAGGTGVPPVLGWPDRRDAGPTELIRGRRLSAGSRELLPGQGTWYAPPTRVAPQRGGEGEHLAVPAAQAPRAQGLGGPEQVLTP